MKSGVGDGMTRLKLEFAGSAVEVEGEEEANPIQLLVSASVVPDKPWKIVCVGGEGRGMRWKSATRLSSMTNATGVIFEKGHDEPDPKDDLCPGSSIHRDDRTSLE